MPKNLLSKLPNKKYKIKLIGKKTKTNIWELNTMINLLYKHNVFNHLILYHYEEIKKHKNGIFQYIYGCIPLNVRGSGPVP